MAVVSHQLFVDYKVRFRARTDRCPLLLHHWHVRMMDYNLEADIPDAFLWQRCYYFRKYFFHFFFWGGEHGTRISTLTLNPAPDTSLS